MTTKKDNLNYMTHLSRTEHIATFEELQAALPPPEHHEYNTKRSWMAHMLTNNMAVFPDFVTQMGRAVHLIDIRPVNELSKHGIIPGSNFYPRDEDGFLEKIKADFPPGSLVAIVDFNGVFSRHVAGVLRSQYGFKFAAVLAGGVRLFRVFGFSVNRSLKDIKKRLCVPVSIHSLESFRALSSNEDRGDVRDRGPYHSERQTLEQVARHVESDLLMWIKMGALQTHGRLSCIDGRSGNGSIGTPGGDFGEMILILSTYEHLVGCDLSLAQIRFLFNHHLDTFGRFYLHTDETTAQRALEHIKENIIADAAVVGEIEAELAERQTLPENYMHDFLDLTPASYRDAIVNYLTLPDCIGCGHLKLMLTKGDQYKVRPGLIRDFLRAFYECCFWDETSHCDYVVLAGSHAECGVLSIDMQHEIKAYTKIPLIAPSIPIKNGMKQMFVSHPSIMTFLRRQQCEWLLEAIDTANTHAQLELQQQSLSNQLPSSSSATVTSGAVSTSGETLRRNAAHDLVSFVTLSKNARKAFNPLVDLSADQHGALSLGYLAASLPIYHLVFDSEHSRCQVEFLGFVEALNTPAPAPSHSDHSKHDHSRSHSHSHSHSHHHHHHHHHPQQQSQQQSDLSPVLSPLSPMVNKATLSEISSIDSAILMTPSPAQTHPIMGMGTGMGGSDLYDAPVPNVPTTDPQTHSPLLGSSSVDQHQFAKRLSTLDDSICHADHHGMVIRQPVVTPHRRQRPSLSHLVNPHLSVLSEDPSFSVTADLHLPSEVHHYPNESGEPEQAP